MQHKWTRSDTILVLDYYYTMRKGDDRADNPAIQHLARLIGITPASVVLKLLNCRALCPRPDFPFQRSNASKLHKAVFEEFKNSRSALRAEAERIKSAAPSPRRPSPSEPPSQRHTAPQQPASRQRQNAAAGISDLAAIPAYLTSPDEI